MLSAFSFGKIIKTFLPGSLLCAALLLVAEALGQVLGGPSIFPIIAGKDVIVATTAALLPVTLILGFVLNTMVWFAINGRMRALVGRRLDKLAAYKALRSALVDRLHVGLKRVAPNMTADGGRPQIRVARLFLFTGGYTGASQPAMGKLLFVVRVPD